ncbi:MAG: hypothetical protein WDA21_05500 [Bacilli bacterium]|jgi:ATP-dependent DNA helicase RecG
MKYGKAYGGSHPQLIEGDIFKMIISVPEFGKKGTLVTKDQDYEAHDKPLVLSDTELSILKAG